MAVKSDAVRKPVAAGFWHADLIRNANFHWILADLEGFNRFHWTESPSFC